MAEEKQEMLMDREEYLANGLHIGTKSVHKDMEKYIFHVKKNQLAVINLEQTDQRIRDAARFLSRYDPEDILVVGRKDESFEPIKAFSDELGTRKITGRFMPGTLTNPNSDEFIEPRVVVVTDPEQDSQAVQEAVDAKMPVVAITDSGNELENIDVAVPANNKARNSIATVYYLLAREVKGEKGEEMERELEDFKPEEQED